MVYLTFFSACLCVERLPQAKNLGKRHRQSLDQVSDLLLEDMPLTKAEFPISSYFPEIDFYISEGILSTHNPTHDYIVEKKLAQGSFGKVFKVSRKGSGAIFAMKAIPLFSVEYSEHGLTNSVINELKVFLKITSYYFHLTRILDSPPPHFPFVRLYNAYYFNGMIIFIMDFVVGQSFDKAFVSPMRDDLSKGRQLRRSEVMRRVSCLRQVILGLDILEHLGISHHDLKWDNILWNPESNEITLLDYGGSIILNPDIELYEDAVGTPEFSPPESCVNSKSPISLYDLLKFDIYSFGVMVKFIMEKLWVDNISAELIELTQNCLREPYERHSPAVLLSTLDEWCDIHFSNQNRHNVLRPKEINAI